LLNRHKTLTDEIRDVSLHQTFLKLLHQKNAISTFSSLSNLREALQATDSHTTSSQQMMVKERVKASEKQQEEISAHVEKSKQEKFDTLAQDFKRDVENLMQEGADINACLYGGKTPLMLTSELPVPVHEELIQFLLDRGAKKSKIGMEQHYKTLGIPSNATPIDIKKAYKELARIYHTDQGSNPSKTKFQEISEAYQALTKDI
jgi:DnaJ-domain-containing protein 1